MKVLLSKLFSAAVAIRNQVYDLGLRSVHHVNAPVISVGNISVGGSGKTPLVELLVEYLHSQKLKAAVVTRGYKRASKGIVVVSDGNSKICSPKIGGDEPVQMARKFPGLVVIADANRVRGCRFALEHFHIDTIILDDAYQHRRCHRDLNIVVIDASYPAHEQRLLPAGRLREPFKNLSRTDIVILSKCGMHESYDNLVHDIRAFTSVLIATTQFIPIALRRIGSDEIFPVDFLRENSVVSLCGIGSPGTFRKTMEALNVHSVDHTTFADHHFFTSVELSTLADKVKDLAPPLLLTTEKDAIRLSEFRHFAASVPIYYPLMHVEFLTHKDEFFRSINSIVSHRKAT